MQKILIADFFKKELKIRHNAEKIKEMQKYDRDSYSIKLEKQANGRDGLYLYCNGDKGLRAFLEDYLELFDPNIAASHNTVIAVDSKIRDLINNPSEISEEIKSKGRSEKKYTVKEIRNMYSEFIELDNKYSPFSGEISRWIELRDIFKK